MGELMLPLQDKPTGRCLEEIWSWNSTVPEAIEKCVQDLFVEQVRARPDAPAVCAWDGELTYSELDALSTKLAGHLVQLGVKCEDVVPLCFEKSMWTVVAMLAVLKAGGAFVPLDPNHPARRHEEILKQTGAQVVLVSAQCAMLWASSSRHVITVNEASTSQLPPVIPTAGPSVEPGNVAYIIFTSGSTGVPKGVVLEHKAVSTSCLGHGQAFGITDLSRVLQFASYMVDACVAEIITTLFYGGCVCVPSDSDRLNDLAKAINIMGVNCALLTPSVARLLDPSVVPSIRILILQGEQVSFADWDRWPDSVQTINGYGPTECSVCCSTYASKQGFKSGIIGKSVASVSWVVDPENHDRLAPLGSVGELLVEGPILARGYLNNIEKTVAAFIDDPTWLIEGYGSHAGRRGRLYKTGDLVQYNGDGNLVYLGRKDSQVKVRGQRVELGEIEHHLRQCIPTANDVVAEVIAPDASHEKAILVAFVSVGEAHYTEFHVATQDAKDAARFTAMIQEVEVGLGNHLPSHMIPSLYIPVDRIPMTASGKTDRKQLRTLGSSFSTQQLAGIQGEYNRIKRQPETEMEHKLQRVWGQVLNMPPDEIGLDDSLFRLGGDSISAMQVVSLCRTEGISLTTQNVMKGKDIKGLAQIAQSALPLVNGTELLHPEQAGIPFELSPIQQMYIQAFPSRDECFDQCFYLQLRNSVNPSAVAQALEAVVQHHAVLRARIRQQDDGTWRQNVTDDISGSFRWRHHRLSNDSTVGSFIADSRRSLDFENGPNVAADLFSINEVQTFFITINHVFVDLVSWRIILQDIEQLVLTGSMSSLPTTPFQSWCRLQRDYAHSHLAPKLVLPFEIKPPMMSYWGIDNHWGTWSDTVRKDFALNAQTTASILGECNEALRTEPVELFISGLIQSFHNIFRDRDVPTIFNEGHGREPWDEKIDLSRTVGWFTTVSPVRCAAIPTEDVVNTIRSTKDGRRSLSHKGLGYFASRFHNPEGIEAFKLQSPMEVLVNYQGLYQQLERQDTLFQRINAPGDQDLDVSLQGGRFAVFVVSIVVQEGRAMVSFMYNRKAKHQDRIARWIQDYNITMQNIVAATHNAGRINTLSDFPNAFHDYDDLEKFTKETLPRLGISNVEDVEDVYKCSPMQQAILLNRMDCPENYWIRSSFKVVQAPGQPAISVPQIRRAWQTVVDRHTILRTIFALDFPGTPGPAQIVLRDRKAGLRHVKASLTSTTSDLFNEHENVPEVQRHGLEHHLTIYELPDGTIFCILEISHAIVDGHSLAIIVRDLTAAYSDLRQLETPPPYSEFISFIEQEDLSESLEYWKCYLGGVEPCLFPSSSAFADEVDKKNNVLKAFVQFEGLAALRSFCNRYELTPFTVIQLAWALVLGRFSNTTSPCFGYLTSRRQLPIDRIDSVAGPMINMLTCRVDVQGSCRILEALRKLQMDVTESNDHQSCSLADIQHALNLGESRLFNTAITYQRYDSKSKPHSENITIQRCDEHDPSEYDVVLHVDEYEKSLELACGYQTSRISSFQAESIADTIGHTISAIVGNPEGELGDLDLLSKKGLNQLLQWNQDVPPAVDRCVHDLFIEQARARPDAPALCAWDGELTYSELDALSTKLAGHLVQLGVKCEDVVPLCFEKSMWTVVAMLAVLKAGGAFLLLDPALPHGRLQSMCHRAQSRLVLSSEDNHILSRDLGPHVIIVGPDLLSAASFHQQTRQPPIAVAPSAPAYIIFTSGSTGTPKGIVMQHGSFCSALHYQLDSLGFTEDCRVFDFASYAFDVAVHNALATLVVGGCLCVPSDDDRKSNIAQTMAKMQVTVADLTPSVARLIEPSEVQTLKILILAGEAIDHHDISRWQNSVQIINAYGPAECAPMATINPFANDLVAGAGIGRGMGVLTWVVDQKDHNVLLAAGQIGELLLEGPLLARGYFHDEERTAAAFIENPTWLKSETPDKDILRRRFYKTGDLVKYNKDGTLSFVDRRDTQVKIRGQRVELGEVEHHVLECVPKVTKAVAEMIQLDGGDATSTLAVFMVFTDGIDLNEAALELSAARLINIGNEALQSICERLPSYMIPTGFFAISQIPMTATGKTDRKRLREIGACFTAKQLAEMRTSSWDSKRRPSTEAERTMQQLWARVLGIELDSIGLDDSFFRLGGDSIAAMKLVGEARRTGLQLSVADIFRYHRLVDLAPSAICVDHSSSAAIVSVDYDGPVQQSFAQGRLWFIEELYPGLNWYLMPFTVRIRGPLQLAALRIALCAIESRHETLRTTFATDANVSVQVVQPFRANQLKIIDLPPGDEQSRLDAVQRDQMTPFDLRTEPGWRVSVYRFDKDDYVLSIVMHHISSDGWSIDVLMRELTMFYSASIRGRDPLSQMQPLPIQYRDFSLWQRQQAQIDEHQRQLSYWLAQLQTSRPAELFCDKPRPATLSGKAGTRTLEIVGSLYAKLLQFCKSHGVTLFVALLAVFRATHFRLTGQDDATIGTLNANRDRWELKDMIGFFVNMQCLRTTIEDESFEQLVDQVQEVVVASLTNQDVPFESIVSKLKKDRDLSRHPLVQLIFVVHSQMDLGQLVLEGVETEAIDGPLTSRFDLEFHFFQRADGLVGNIIFSTDLYALETIDNMLSVFNSVLEQCLREPAAAVASLPLLTDADYAKLDEMGLVRIKETAYPRESSVVDLFRQQASACPSRIAVKDASEEMTYAQLDKASDFIAWWLRKRSFAPETLVGVFANRRCQTIVAFLGILKANLAYLPFDANIPSKRMESILSSLPGRKIVFLGADIQLPDNELNQVEFVPILEVLVEHVDELTDGQLAYHRPNTVIEPSATSLAYVMFTSGSTGQPKGVMVEHRGIVRLVRDNKLVQYLPVSPVMAHVTSLAFDNSTWEIYGCLCNGGTLICIEAATVLDPEAVLRTFRQHHVNTTMLTPALFRTYVAEIPAAIAMLDTICIQGEALYQSDLLSVEHVFGGKLINAYGPTENTVTSTMYVMSRNEDCTNGVPIGDALSNSGAYVMDANQRLVPIGVVGELVVTGDGVARGYTDPERDVDRFIWVTIRGETFKAYRTGDYTRHRPTDGQLEFFGRMDGQVKIRGNRVELGEIEHVLRSYKSVREAVTVLQQRDGDEPQLAGFVTVHEGIAMVDEQPNDGDEMEHVDAWEEHFDFDFYSPIGNVRPENIGRDFVGWTSMYDGSEIDKVEMNEWLDDTINTMLNGRRPGHVLEIGSGTGMILFNLGDNLQSYVGLDPSRKAVEFISETVKTVPALVGKVRMHKATAADIVRLDRPIAASLVVMNSVVQYFPSLEYLFRIVQQLLELEGLCTLFFGDIRSYALYQEFLATRALHMAGEKASKADLRRMMGDMERVERELLVDPAFFTALPSRLPALVEHVEILPKRMKATNELSCYRYAAVVHAKSRHGQTQEPAQAVRRVEQDQWINFVERKLDRQSLLQQLKSRPGSPTTAVSNIPHSKTILSRYLVESLKDVAVDRLGCFDWLSLVRQKAQHCSSLSATDLLDLAQEAGYRVEISWNRQYSQQGGLDAIFHRYQPRRGENRVMFHFPTDHEERSLHSLSSRPLRQQFLQKTQQQLLKLLEVQLPAYMVPQTITVLEALPMNQNGKIDRNVLAQWRQERTSPRGPGQQPTSAAELRMQQLWACVLNIKADSIWLDDSFFRLGGDSIAAMKLVGEARKTGLRLSVADVFRHPKLADLATVQTEQCSSAAEQVPAFSLLGKDVNATQVCDEAAAMCGVDASIVEDIYPCSPLQEGLMSLTAKRAGNYVMQSVLALRAEVDEHAFRAAWEHVARSTSALRTRIVQHSELGLLQVVVGGDIQWTESKELEKYLKEDKANSMGIGDSLTRYALVKEPCGGKRWFAWTMHHALYDGWSLPRILHAVRQVYSGAALERQPSFNAFIKHLGQQDHKAATVYWQAALADCEAALFPPLPSTVTQPVADTTIKSQCPPLSQSTMDTTTATLIRAAWALVASHYTGSDDVVFGTTVTGRNAPVASIDAMIGPTLATVPVRVRIQSDQIVSSFLEALQQQATEMIAYEQTGLQQIAKIGPGARHACGFQTLLIIQSAGDLLDSDNTLGEWWDRSELQDFTTYALTVQCTLVAEGVQMTASFDARVVEQWVVEKMLHQFSFVMRQLAETGAGKRVVDIEIITAEDRQQLWAWNQDVPSAVDRCVHDLFIEQARARPNEPAICAWDGELTYSKLDALSSRLAGHLVQLGVKPESLVPLCFEKSMWTVVAMLAVLKAGGAFVPLDPDHPASRHEEMFRQTEAHVVLASAQHAMRCAGLGRHVVAVSEASISQLPMVVDTANTAVKPENAAYVIFTSGSTGVPKGVVLEHKAVSTSCLGHGQAFGITDLSRVLQFASYTFDACIAEIITTLMYGGCICVPSDNDRRNNLTKAINAMEVNWAFLTPSVVRLLDPSLVVSLKILAIGGEQSSFADWNRWPNSVQTIHVYGPTECCIFCTGHTSKQGLESSTIGTSVASVSWVVDPKDHHKLVPLGSVGELLVEGPILARGYLNDDEKTAAAFIDGLAWLLDGCEGHAGRRGRLYKTGDLVRYDSDGNLVCLGRKDSQVKLRGQRVELGEIEHHVRECLPEAKQLAVEVIMPSGEGGYAVLAAFVQLDDDTRNALLRDRVVGTDTRVRVVFLAEIEEQLAERLPGHMVPTVFFALLHFPTTTSGKTDRKRLRDIGASFTAQQLAEMRTSCQGLKRRPSTEAERTMQQLWARVLGIELDSIGLDDSFFRLGGDSITAMKLVGEARRTGLQLSVADIFRHPRLVDLVSLQTTQCSSTVEDVPAFSLLTPTMKDAIFSAIKPFDCTVPMDRIFDVIPASSTQKFFLANGVHSPREAFNYFFIDLGTAVDVQVLKTSCCTLLDHFPILRTHFVYFQGRLLQVVPRHQDLPFSIFEVDGSLAEESQAIFMRDLDQTSPLGLPTSFILVQNSSGIKRLIFRLSHAQYDGVCIPVMLRALASIYQQEPLLPSPGFNNYLSYAQNRLSASTKHWRNLLAGSNITNITSILRHKACRDTILRPVKVERQICTPQLPAGLTMASLVSSAWAVMLSHISGEEDVVYGLVVTGRNSDLPGITEVMGPCVNFVPVRARPGSTITATELVHSVQSQYLSLGESDSMGLDDIVQHCTNWPAESQFDSIVLHQNIEEQPEVDFAGETTKLQWIENPFKVPREFAIISYPRGNSLAITVRSNTGILTNQCAEKLLAMLCDTIIQLSGNLEKPLGMCKSSLLAYAWDDE